MLSLRPYTHGQLQTAAALLRDAQRAGMDIAGVLAAIGSAVSLPITDVKNQSRTKTLPICRYCGAKMYQCSQASALAGVPVYVCSAKCGYSVMAGGK